MVSASPSPMKQLTVVNYICVYIRFVKDGSLLLVLLAWATVNLGDFIGNVMGSHRDSLLNSEREGRRNREDEESIARVPVIKAIVTKGLRYTKAILMLQVVYAIMYHVRIDFENDICRHRYGYMILLLVGEQECGRGGRWMLFMLDSVIVFMQLLLLAMQLTPDDRYTTLQQPWSTWYPTATTRVVQAEDSG